MRDKELGFREIGRRLGRGENAGGSVKRFLDRNKHTFPGVWRELDVYERARYMYERARAKAKIPRKKGKLASNPNLRARVIELLVDKLYNSFKTPIFVYF